jgi:enhancer of polycomb-like protein
MEVFEETASAQAPFASVDNTVVAYDLMVPSLNQLSSAAALLPHAKAVHEFWKARRLEGGNQSLHAALKFETHQETDDMDPYVCFRRREARQTRKTRARDVLSAEKLKKLRRELEDGRQLIQLSHERELHKKELILAEKAVFEQRQKFKAMKIRLGIKGDDEDLIHQKVSFPSVAQLTPAHLLTARQPQKRRATETPALQRPPGSHLRLAVRPDGRLMDADLVQLVERLADKESELRRDLETKVAYHRKWNNEYVDLTRGPLSPVDDQRREISFRPAKTQYLMTPPASSTESMDIDEEPMSPVADKLPVFQFRAGGQKELPYPSRHPPRQPAYRRRIGRLGRLWIDRRVLASHAPPSPDADADDASGDRWKYDSDDEDMPMSYEIDPFSTEALQFRAAIALPSFMWKRAKDPALDAVREIAHHSAQALPAPPAPAGAPVVAHQAHALVQTPIRR